MAKETGLMTIQQAVESYDKGDLDLIKKTVAKDATDEELALFLWTAKVRGLNPLTRQIHFVVRGKGEKRQGTIQTGIDGFRLIAERTGHYAPSPKPTHFEYMNGKLVRATVYGIKIVGKDAFEYSATAKLSEYKVDYSPLWQKMPETMLEKCAEAKLLRKGFPEDMSGLYTDEEMLQADVPVTMHPAELEDGESDVPAQDLETTILANIDPDNPYSHYLETCPEHGVAWSTNNWGKRCHKTEEGWCNFKDIIQPILKRNAEMVKLDKRDIFTSWCKQTYDGKTWSKMTEEEQVDALYRMDKMAEANVKQPLSENPVVAEAQKMGAEIVPPEPEQIEMEEGTGE